MRSCSNCAGKREERHSTTLEGIPYTYLKCTKCNEEMIDMKMMELLAQEYRKLKQHRATLSKWGSSLGVRIPKELTEKYRLKDHTEALFIPEKDGIKIVLT